MCECIPPGKEMWNERFSAEEFVYGKEPNQFLKETFNSDSLLFSSPILMLGDGEGRNGVFLAEKGFEVTSLDFSENALKKAKLLAAEKNVQLKTVLADALTHDFGNEQWGSIISIFFHLASESRKTIHQKIKKALKPNGLFLLEAYSPRQLNFQSGGPKDINLLYTTEELKSDFNDFEILLLKETETELSEGPLHQGRASVIRFLGKKK